jgi:hypothetical protein
MIKNIVSVAATLVGAGALLTGCNFEQPRAGCISQDSPSWAVKYELKSGQSIPTGCAAAPKGELIGVFKFTDPLDATKSVLTIRPGGLASRAARDPVDTVTEDGVERNPQNATGKLAEEPDAQDFCEAKDFVPARVDTKTPTASEQVTTITYQYNSVKVFSSPSVPGTQITGDFSYTRTYDGVTCTLEYTMNGIWPAVPCKSTSDRPSESCGEGSGVNPDFDVVCSTDLVIAGGFDGTCLPAKPIPSLKEATE